MSTRCRCRCDPHEGLAAKATGLHTVTTRTSSKSAAPPRKRASKLPRGHPSTRGCLCHDQRTIFPRNGQTPPLCTTTTMRPGATWAACGTLAAAEHSNLCHGRAQQPSPWPNMTTITLAAAEHDDYNPLRDQARRSSPRPSAATSATAGHSDPRRGRVHQPRHGRAPQHSLWHRRRPR